MLTKKIGDFLTDEEITRAINIYEKGKAAELTLGRMVDLIETQIIQPQMDRINQALGQTNDSRFLAWTVIYAMLQASNQ